MAVLNWSEALEGHRSFGMPLKVKLKAAGECPGMHPRSWSGNASRETLENMEESYAARLAEDSREIKDSLMKE